MDLSALPEPLTLQHRQPIEAALAALSFGQGENALSDPQFAAYWEKFLFLMYNRD